MLSTLPAGDADPKFELEFILLKGKSAEPTSLSPLTGDMYTFPVKVETFLRLPLTAAFHAEARRGLSGGVDATVESRSLSLSEDSLPDAELKEEEGVRGGVSGI